MVSVAEITKVGVNHREEGYCVKRDFSNAFPSLSEMGSCICETLSCFAVMPPQTQVNGNWFSRAPFCQILIFRQTLSNILTIQN